MDYNLILSVVCAGMAGVGAFFHTKYQSESNKQKIEDVKIQFLKDNEELKKENEILSKRLEASFKKLDVHGEEIGRASGRERV